MIKISRITREDIYEYERPMTSRADWLDNFAKRMQDSPSIVETRKANQSILDQLTSILVNQPTYSSVDEVVRDMRKRVGLDDYLQIVNTQLENNLKVASSLDVTEDHITKLLAHHNVASNKIMDIIQAAKDAVNVHKHNNFLAISNELLNYFKQYGLDVEVTEGELFKTWLNNLMIARDINKTEDMHNIQDEDVSDDADYQDNQDFFKGMK
jgi:hypothetical protein